MIDQFHHPDDANILILSNVNSPKPAFLRVIYHKKELTVRTDLPGLFQFSDWLPINRVLQGSGSPVTYLSQGLGKHLGLTRLYITFSGYWPEKGAWMTTGTFKECEAFSVLARFPKESGKVLVVNPGSIGESREPGARALVSYAILDTETEEVEHVRIPNPR